MKKIFLTLAFVALVFSAKAQVSQKNSSKELVSTTYNITAKEDPHNPLVNGIPYNQYKIQVQQEMQKKAEAQAQEKAKQKLEQEKISKLKMPKIPDGKQEQISNQKIEAKSTNPK